MKILVRTAIGLLAAFHAVVGYTALHPQVSAHYRGYYITGTDFMSPWQHQDLVVLRPGTTYAADEPTVVFNGWYRRDDRQRWNAGRTPRFVFRVGDAGRPDAPHALLLDLAPLGAQRTVWRLNGHEIGRHLVDGPTTLRLELDSRLLRPGENELQVSLPDARQAGRGNPKMWALRFESLRFE